MSRNFLSAETSPYLLQHKDNPVHWYPWGDAAFAEAQARNVPILLSIGYAACHWCHVMAHESFENHDIAQLMNSHFVNVKVDREERPDIDRVYMEALQSLGEPGGWPLTMFLTPQGQPFWGGTYFPPTPRYGRPAFPHVLTEIARIWRDEPQKVSINTEAIAAALSRGRPHQEPVALTPRLLHQAATTIAGGVDMQYGGLTGAPKFPQAPLFNFLWETYIRTRDPQLSTAVITTLTSLGQGGIYDHLSGGLARYSVDHRWLVPHFEKMLYDNAQFVSLLSRAWVATGSSLFRQRIEETLTFVLASMRTPERLFASSHDADSEGQEGKYYVWSKSEISRLLGPDAVLFNHIYDVTDNGNWEGHSILNRLNNSALPDTETEARLAHARSVLLEARNGRVPPGFDDKALADWNGLMIAALAEAGLLFARTEWITEATTVFERLLALLTDDGILRHAYRSGSIRGHATADDYAQLARAALALHAATGNPSYIRHAERFAAALVDRYWDESTSTFFFTPAEANDLILRPRSLHDDATPNANGVMLHVFKCLALLTGKELYQVKADSMLSANASTALANPFAHPGFLAGALAFHDPIQAILVNPQPADTTSPLLQAFLHHHGPSAVIARIDDPELLPDGHPARHKALVTEPSLFVCRGQVCASPAKTVDQVADALKFLGLGPA
jgi:hypothetical protein